MLMYILIGLSLVLVGIVGLQFCYTFYIENLYRQRRSYLKDLERKFAIVNERLATAERRLAQQEGLLVEAIPGYGREDEVWADVIDGDVGR